MATTWTDLKTEVADVLHRGGLTSNIPTFIGYGERMLAHDLFINPLVSSATVTVSAAASSGTVPTGAFAYVSVQIASGAKLHYVTPDGMVDVLADAGSIEKPIFWSQRGTLILVGPSWTAGGNLTVQYFKQETALSGSTATNWYLDNAPKALLYASCIEAETFINAADSKQRLDVFRAQYENERDRIIDQWGVVNPVARAKQLQSGSGRALRPSV